MDVAYIIQEMGVGAEGSHDLLFTVHDQWLDDPKLLLLLLFI